MADSARKNDTGTALVRFDSGVQPARRRQSHRHRIKLAQEFRLFRNELPWPLTGSGGSCRPVSARPDSRRLARPIDSPNKNGRDVQLVLTGLNLSQTLTQS